MRSERCPSRGRSPRRLRPSSSSRGRRDTGTVHEFSRMGTNQNSRSSVSVRGHFMHIAGKSASSLCACGGVRTFPLTRWAVPKAELKSEGLDGIDRGYVLTQSARRVFAGFASRTFATFALRSPRLVVCVLTSRTRSGETQRCPGGPASPSSPALHFRQSRIETPFFLLKRFLR